MLAKKLRTTVALSEDLVDAMDALVREGEAESRNDFLEKALRNQLAASRRAATDAEFAQMANDPSYQEEAFRIAEDFSQADWEALRAEGGLRSDSIALGEQVRAIAKTRLGSRWGMLSPEALRRLDRALLVTLDLPGHESV